MKGIICVCVILTIGLFNYGFAQDINGKWKGQMQGPNGTMDIVFNFNVNADTLTGAVEGPMGDMSISNGKVNVHQFSFDVSFNDMTINHQCTIVADSISMKIPGMQGDTMEITLKRLIEPK